MDEGFEVSYAQAQPRMTVSLQPADLDLELTAPFSAPCLSAFYHKGNLLYHLTCKVI